MCSQHDDRNFSNRSVLLIRKLPVTGQEYFVPRLLCHIQQCTITKPSPTRIHSGDGFMLNQRKSQSGIKVFIKQDLHAAEA